jgi:hypothetical protein
MTVASVIALVSVMAVASVITAVAVMAVVAAGSAAVVVAVSAGARWGAILPLPQAAMSNTATMSTPTTNSGVLLPF